MSSVSSTSSSSSSKTYSYSSNGLSGLISGMDTETMVKKLLAGTQTKIDKQKQQQQVLKWKQTMYQSAISDINTLKSRYFDSSYDSTLTTNLSSAKFFNSKTSAVTSGSAVSVSSTDYSANVGSSTFNVLQLATATTLTASSTMSSDQSITGSAIDFTALQTALSSGDLTFNMSLDGVSKEITLSKSDFTDSTNISASELGSVLSQKTTDAFGTYVTASVDSSTNKAAFKVNINASTVASDGTVSSTSTAETGHELTITGASASKIGITPGSSSLLSTSSTIGSLSGISGSTYSFSINGKDFSFSATDTLASVITKVNASSANVKMSYSSATDKFTIQSTQTGSQYGINITQKSGNLLSMLFGSSQVSTGSSLGGASLGTSVSSSTAISDVSALSGMTGVTFYQADGTTAATTLGEIGIISDGTNSYTASFDSTTASLKLTGTVGSTATLTNDSLKSYFGVSSYTFGAASTTTGVTAGKDLIININGNQTSRSSNTFTIDGLTVTANSLSNGSDTVVNTTRDTSSVVSAIKSFVSDYNSLISGLYSKITEDATYKDYPALTDAQKDEMSDTEITAWEKNAKIGLLRNDDSISTFLQSMDEAFYTQVSSAGLAAYSIGIETVSTDLSGKLTLDESLLTTALSTDPDGVAKLFTDSTNGISTLVSKAIDSAAKLSAANPGSLVQIAGASGFSANAKNNDIYNELQTISDKLDDLQDKYDDDKERYWNKFTSMETTISNYQSQSSMISSTFSS